MLSSVGCYADDAKAEAAQASLREFVAGALTGVVRKAGNELMAVADRKQVEHCVGGGNSAALARPLAGLVTRRCWRTSKLIRQGSGR